MAEDNEKSSPSDKDSINTDLGTPVSCICGDKPSCGRLWHSFNSYWRLVGLFSGVLLYTLIGGAIFNAVERPNELRTIQESREARMNSINEFFDLLTNSTNVTREELEALNTTGAFLRLGAAVARAEAAVLAEQDPTWDYASAVFFASTVITTIGYGTIAPSTAAGQLIFIFYAIIGIPLALLFLTQIGKIIEVWVNRTLKPVERRWGKTVSRAVASTSILLVVIVFFMLIPAIIYTAAEGWNYRESVYFTVVTLTTVGFGDFVPSSFGESGGGGVGGFYKILTSAWLWLGLSLVATLIAEMQDLLTVLAERFRTSKCCSGVLQKLIPAKTAEEQRMGHSPSPEEPAETTGI